MIQPAFPPIATRVISNPAAVKIELGKLDLDAGIIWDVGLSALAVYTSLTGHNPSYSHPHITGSALRTLRDHLTPVFEAEKRREIEVTTHSSDDFTILTARGDSQVGNTDQKAHPNSYRPRGPKTSELLQSTHQPALPHLGIQVPRLYVLLFYLDATTKDMRIELSQPASMKRVQPQSKKFRFRGWIERIIIPQPQSQQGQSAPVPSPGTSWTPSIGPDELELSRRSDVA